MPDPTLPKFRSFSTVQVLNVLGDDDYIAFMARGSTGGGESTHERNVALVKKLLAERHKKPLEHCVIALRIQMPLFVARQWDTYRHQSRSELSGRYSHMPEDFYIPKADRPLGQEGSRMDYAMVALHPDDQADAIVTFQDVATYCWREYQRLLRLGVSREMARIVLPSGFFTEVRTTLNLLSALNICSQRIDWGEAAKDPTHPQYEIEDVALQLWAVLEDRFPAVCEAFAARGYSI